MNRLDLIAGLRNAGNVIGSEFPKWWAANESETLEVPDEERKSVMNTAPRRQPTKLEKNPATLGEGIANTALAVAPFNKPVLAAEALGYAADADASPVAKVAKAVGRAVGKGPEIKGLPSLNALRGVTSSADEAIDKMLAERRAGNKSASIFVKESEPLRFLPKTDSPYIETEQFLPARQNPRTKGGVPYYNERTEALLDDPRAKQAIRRNMLRGQHMGMQEWYGTNPLWEAAQQEGLSFDDFNRLMMHQANASQRSPVPGQIKRGSATWVADRQGLLDPDMPQYTLPKGYGSLAQKQIIENAYDIAAGKGMDTSKKLGRFHQNLMGNLDPVTVDVMAMRGPTMATKDPRWLAREVRAEKPSGETEILRPRQMFESGEMTVKEALNRPGFWEAAPMGAEYGAFEDLYRAQAKRAGMAPAEGQATAWYGSGTEAGLRTAPQTYLQAVEDRIAHTAQQRNETPQQVLRSFLRGEKPLLGVGAGVGLDQMEKEQ